MHSLHLYERVVFLHQGIIPMHICSNCRYWGSDSAEWEDSEQNLNVWCEEHIVSTAVSNKPFFLMCPT